jgi:AcrR family transcriptional regulator
MEGPATLSVAEVAAASGFTRQAIYRAIKDGRLGRWLIRDSRGRARLVPEAVKAIRSGGILSLRVDTAAPALPPAPSPPSWDVMASWANALLCPEHWGPPPWPPDRWLTLEGVIDEAEELAIAHGDYSAAVMAALADEEGDE